MKTILRIAVFLGVLAIFAALGLAASSTSSFHNAPAGALQLKNPYSVSDSDAVRAGGALFAANCASCHGADAMGTGNVPALARGAAQTASDGALFWFIGNGSPENGMPPSKLPEQDRWKVVAFLKSLAGSPAHPALSAQAALDEDATSAPSPRAPFTDYRFERPGQIHRIEARELPDPAPATSVGNGPDVVARPKDAWPKVPPGFQVQLYASGLDNPRLIRTAPNGDVFLAESKAGQVKVFRGVTADGKAEQTHIFASHLNQPYGIAFYPPGPSPKWVYVGNTDAVVRFPYESGDLKAKSSAQRLVALPSSSRGHWTRDLQFSADGKTLFVGVGSASNIDDPDTTPGEMNRADILAMNPDGSGVHVYASGIRNAGGGLAIQPGTGALWCSVNERDGLGDNLVPDYITHVSAGGYYGWPWWYIGGHQDPRHAGKHPELKARLITPDVLLQPHNASLEMVFYDGKQFPSEYEGDIFASQHGSWNRSVRTGYELIRVPLHHSAKASGEYEDFMTGFVIDNAHVWGRPVGVTVAQDGALLVTDDGSNSIWRIEYKGKK